MSYFSDMMDCERTQQIVKWGFQREHSDLYWLGILMEEVGEVAKSIIEGEGAEDLMKELVQVATVCQAFFEDCPVFAHERGEE